MSNILAERGYYCCYQLKIKDMRLKGKALSIIAGLACFSCCTPEKITISDEVTEGDTFSCSVFNGDISVLRTVLNEFENGGSIYSIDGNGTITFTSGASAAVVVRNSYSFDYSNPVVGFNGKCWTIDGNEISAMFSDEDVLKFKAEDDKWFAWYNDAWHELYSFSEGETTPVFTAMDTENSSVTITLGSGNSVSLPFYDGEDELELSATSFSFGAEGGSGSLTVTSANPWEAKLTSESSGGEDWVTLSRTEGSGEDDEVTLTVLANDGSSRTAVWTISSGDLSTKLTVSQSGTSGDTSGGIISSDDSGDDEDIVSNTEFDRTVLVEFSTSGSASVSGTTSDIVATVSGNDVTIVNSGTDKVIYSLSGTTTDGFLRLEGTRKQAIVLNGVNITNGGGAAINNQNKKRTFVVVNGSNYLEDCKVNSSGDYPDQSAYDASEQMKACFFSEGQLIFSGNGSLNVTVNGKTGIESDDYLRFMSSPTVSITAKSTAGHALKGNDYLQIDNGNITASVAADMKKGFVSDSLVRITGGTSVITVTGGTAYDSDADEPEYKGSAGVKADYCFEMTGGSLSITNTGKGGKGIRAGSYYNSSDNTHTLPDSYISGGTINIKTSGTETNGVSCKGIKIGWVVKSGNTVKAAAGNLKISGGSVTVSECRSEGIECKGALTITGGEVYSYSTGDDAINSQGDMVISGGYVYGNSSQNDCLDANGDMKLNGGVVYAVTTKGNPEVALDANTEGGKCLYINSGATVIAIGGLENGASLSQNCYSITSSANKTYALYNGSTPIVIFKTPQTVASSLVVSAPSLSKAMSGVSVTGGTSYCSGMITAPGTVSGGSSLTLSSYSAGGGGFNPGGGGHRPF